MYPDHEYNQSALRGVFEACFFHHLSGFMQSEITSGNLPRQQFHGQRMSINCICNGDKILHISFFGYFHMRISLEKQRQRLWRQFFNAAEPGKAHRLIWDGK